MTTKERTKPFLFTLKNSVTTVRVFDPSSHHTLVPVDATDVGWTPRREPEAKVLKDGINGEKGKINGIHYKNRNVFLR